MGYFRSLFVDKRFDCNDRVLRVLKLRTMRVEAENRSGETRTVKNNPRGTRCLDRILHGLSLNKPPPIFNVQKEGSVSGLASTASLLDSCPITAATKATVSPVRLG